MYQTFAKKWRYTYEYNKFCSHEVYDPEVHDLKILYISPFRDFISFSTNVLKGVVGEVGDEDEILKGICQEYQPFMSVIYLKSLRIRNVISGQKGALSASRGQSLLEHFFFLNCLKPLLKISHLQVGRSLQEFYLHTETSSKLSFKHVLNLKQVFPFDWDRRACVGACDLYFYIHFHMSLKPTKRFLP